LRQRRAALRWGSEVDRNARDEVLFLQIEDASGVSIVRWQSFWRGPVTWDGQVWNFQPLKWSGVSSGVSVGGQAGFTVPDVASTRELLLGAALDRQYQVTMRVYQWDKQLALVAPNTTDLVLIGVVIGEMLSASEKTFESISIAIGIALSRQSAFFPPYICDNANIGNPCILT
jgi:hypothetical protein